MKFIILCFSLIIVFINNEAFVKAQNVIKLLMCSHYNNFNTETKFITEKIESYINKDNTFPDKIKVDITMKNENDYLKELRKIGTERINRYDIYMIEDRYITDYLPYISNLNGALLRSDVELNPIIEKSFIQDCMRYSRLYNKTTLKCMPFSMDFGLLITQKNLPQITSLKSLKESIKKELKASDPNKKIYGFGSQYRGKSILYRFMEWSYYYGLNEDKIFIHNNFENALKGIADLRKEINEILPNELAEQDINDEKNSEIILNNFIDKKILVYHGWYSALGYIKDKINLNEFNYYYFPSSERNKYSLARIKYNLVVSKASNNTYLSKKIVNYLTNDLEFQREYSRNFFHISPISIINGENLKNLSLSNLHPINFPDNVISTNILYKENDPIIITDIKPRSWSVVESNLVVTLQKFFKSKVSELNDKYIISTLKELNNDIGTIYDSTIDTLKFNFSSIKSYGGIPVLVITIEVIYLIITIFFITTKCYKYGIKKILNYHTPVFYISSHLSVILAIVGYYFMFDPPYFIVKGTVNLNLQDKTTYNVISKCSYRMWSFDLSLNLLFLALINKVKKKVYI
jgi:hypothetical protein